MKTNKIYSDGKSEIECFEFAGSSQQNGRESQLTSLLLFSLHSIPLSSDYFIH